MQQDEPLLYSLRVDADGTIEMLIRSPEGMVDFFTSNAQTIPPIENFCDVARQISQEHALDLRVVIQVGRLLEKRDIETLREMLGGPFKEGPMSHVGTFGTFGIMIAWEEWYWRRSWKIGKRPEERMVLISDLAEAAEKNPYTVRNRIYKAKAEGRLKNWRKKGRVLLVDLVEGLDIALESVKMGRPQKNKDS